MATATGKSVWVGRVISILVSLLFLFSGVMKLVGGPQVAEEFARLGLPESMLVPLGILEIACVAVYLIPATAVIGAILMAGYVGGTIVTAWRVGDPVYLQIALGLLLWLGLYLREPRLRPLIPMRKP